MQQVDCIKKENGFELKYICEKCSFNINKMYYYFPFCNKNKDDQYYIIKCPNCFDRKDMNTTDLKDYKKNTVSV